MGLSKWLEKYDLVTLLIPWIVAGIKALRFIVCFFFQILIKSSSVKSGRQPQNIQKGPHYLFFSLSLVCEMPFHSRSIAFHSISLHFVTLHSIALHSSHSFHSLGWHFRKRGAQEGRDWTDRPSSSLPSSSSSRSELREIHWYSWQSPFGARTRRSCILGSTSVFTDWYLDRPYTL